MNAREHFGAVVFTARAVGLIVLIFGGFGALFVLAVLSPLLFLALMGAVGLVFVYRVGLRESRKNRLENQVENT